MSQESRSHRREHRQKEELKNQEAKLASTLAEVEELRKRLKSQLNIKDKETADKVYEEDKNPQNEEEDMAIDHKKN